MSITEKMFGYGGIKGVAEDVKEGTKKAGKTLFDRFKEASVQMNKAAKKKSPAIKKKGSEIWERFKEASIEAHERAERNPQRSLLARSRRFK